MKRREFIGALGGTSLAVIAGCVSSDDDNSNEAAQQGTGNSTDGSSDGSGSSSDEELVVIEEHSFEVIEEYESEAVEDDYGVVGVARNNSDNRLDIFINVRFYDADEVQVEDFTANSSGVEADGRFEFEAPLIDASPDDVETYEVGWEAYE